MRAPAPHIVVDRLLVRELAEAQAALVLWDVRPLDRHAGGHIPGAVSIGEPSRELRDAVSQRLLPAATVAARLGAAGIDPTARIVVYGERGTWNPYFARHVLRRLGAARVAVYHDGIEDWVAAGGAVASGDSRGAAVAVEPRWLDAHSIDTDEVLARLGEAQLQFLDVRTVGEFEARDIRAARGGRIPGALNVPYESHWIDAQAPARRARGEVADTAGMSLQAPDRIRALYAALDPARETIVYCQSGARATLSAAMLEAIGFARVRVYEASWLDYAARAEAPVENERLPAR